MSVVLVHHVWARTTKKVCWLVREGMIGLIASSAILSVPLAFTHAYDHVLIQRRGKKEKKRKGKEKKKKRKEK